MLFQIVDDLLDFTGDSETLGKPAAAQDLREGKATLAVLDLLASGAPRARARVERAMAASSGDAPEVTELTRMLDAEGSLGRVRDRARLHAVSAVEDLMVFPDGPARRALQSLPELLLARDR
jgi:octaprenyl-diphosphate synthase